MINETRIKSSRIFYHLIYWVIFIFYELIFAILNHIPTSIPSYLYYYSCNILLFYTHFGVLNHCLNGYQRKYGTLVLMIFGEMITASVLKGLLDYYTISHTMPANQFWHSFQVYAGLNVYRDFYYLFLSTVLWSALNLGKFRRETTTALLKSAQLEASHSKLEYQFAQAQNAFLKQQINPHLLFNTLNAIYSSIYIKSPEDSRLVLLLSEIMHFSYEDADPQGRVPLKKEIEQLKNLIELNSYRFQKKVQLELSIIGDPGEFLIIPLVLLTLTENMFKHGDLRHTPRKLEISISPDGRMRYLSMNVPKPKHTYKKGTSLGLSNTKLRLDYAYFDNYQFTVEDSDELFRLDLNINLAYERNNN